MSDDVAPGDSVEVVMLKGLLDRINEILKPHGWVLLRARFLDSDAEEHLPTYLATILPGSAAELALTDATHRALMSIARDQEGDNES